MAMLAEPRRKQKVINLRAKNNAWSNDNTKFGQRMLEKMGWKSGKGLGANENGITEHVVARYKNDEKGLGFEDKNDQWTKHEDDFNALLANLSNANDNSDNLHSGVSLEDKSKKSKARIHYHKFTRGKDISRYSEKDLANIFGKKSFKQTIGVEMEVVAEPIIQDSKTTEQIFTEKGSMEDYFKNKLAAFKSKSKGNIINVNDDYEEPSFAFHGFSQDVDDAEVQDEESNENGENSFEQDSVNVKKKKKKSKNPDNIEPSENVFLNTQDESQNSDHSQDYIEKIKKKKRSKNKSIVDVPEIQNDTLVVCEDLVCKAPDTDMIVKKKKKSKKKDNNDDSSEKSCSDHNVGKISKKNRQLNITKTYNEDENAIESITEVPKKKKKNKKL